MRLVRRILAIARSRPATRPAISSGPTQATRPGRGDPSGQQLGTGQRIGDATGVAGYPEPAKVQHIGQRADVGLGRALARGFTTVRDPAGGDAGLARAIAENLIASPRYLWTGAALSQTGGHGDARGPGSETCPCYAHGCEVVDGVDPLRRAVRERFRRGAHAIKIMTSGGVMSLADPIAIPQYCAEEIRAVTDEAARRGSYVAAHAYSPEAIRHSIGNGVRSIEHGNLLDAPTAAAMASAGAFLVPTLAAYDAMERRGEQIGMPAVSRRKNREVLESGQQAVELARAAGVRVGFGTDLMGPLEDEQLNGLRLQAEAGGIWTTLTSATSVNAELIGRPDLGRVAQGCTADLLILGGSICDDPSVAWSPHSQRTIVQHGRVIAGSRAPR